MSAGNALAAIFGALLALTVGMKMMSPPGQSVVQQVTDWATAWR